jgi:hypothetical protein
MRCLMSRSSPPSSNSAGVDATDSGAIDSGWSSVPPAPSAPLALPVPPTDVEPSGLRRLPGKGRAEGTLLGVAPPQAHAPTLPLARSPIVVHSGVARPHSAPAEPVASPPRESRPPEALPIPLARRVRPAPPNLPAEPSRVTAAKAALTEVEVPVRADQIPSFNPHVGAPVIIVPEHEIRVDVEAPSFGQALKNRVRFAGIALPLWRVLAPAIGLLVLGAASVAAVGTWRLQVMRSAVAHRALPSVPSSTRATAPAASLMPPIEPARTATPGEALSADEVLTLAMADLERRRQSAKMFRETIAGDPSALRDKLVIADLRRLTADPQTALEGLATVAALPGSTSADLLYEIWTATPNRTDATELARALLYSRDVLRKASPALSVALELRLAETCQANLAILPLALQVGDRRSFPLLNKLKRKDGCGTHRRQDCFACLREGEELEAAITAVKGRRPPNL